MASFPRSEDLLDPASSRTEMSRSMTTASKASPATAISALSLFSTRCSDDRNHAAARPAHPRPAVIFHEENSICHERNRERLNDKHVTSPPTDAQN